MDKAMRDCISEQISEQVKIDSNRWWELTAQDKTVLSKLPLEELSLLFKIKVLKDKRAVIDNSFSDKSFVFKKVILGPRESVLKPSSYEPGGSPIVNFSIFSQIKEVSIAHVINMSKVGKDIGFYEELNQQIKTDLGKALVNEDSKDLFKQLVNYVLYRKTVSLETFRLLKNNEGVFAILDEKAQHEINDVIRIHGHAEKRSGGVDSDAAGPATKR